MTGDQLNTLLQGVHALFVLNPFSDARANKEAEILAELGPPPSEPSKEPTFSPQLHTLIRWLETAEPELLKLGSAGKLPKKWNDALPSFAFFSLYHQVAADLDRLIQRNQEDLPKNRALFRKVQDGIAERHTLIAHAPDRIWNRPEHLLACFYQVRRAYYFIHHEIAGQSQPIKTLRIQIWESVFTKDMMSYQQWMYDAVGRFPTLVLGPSGSGKEVVARAIGLSRFIPYDIKAGHFITSAQASFHPVNLAALSETLIESELFGHRKGSFTGAMADRAGLFATAGSYGTVFLDEIGEVSQATQVRLLRLLQSGEFQAIGDNHPAYFTGKVIAATHRDLNAEMRAGRFREDFYYRLCGDQVSTVALHDILRDRPEDLTTSVNYICTKLFGTEGAQHLCSRILNTLQRDVPADYTWPGNFRELEQAVRNIVVRDEYTPMPSHADKSIDGILKGSHTTLAEWNRIYVQQAFKNAGSYREAARRLGVDQRTIKKWVSENGN
jgi:transcriptional regulator of acetoin/glycerol metabolism